jgi:hypothetical protein
MPKRRDTDRFLHERVLFASGIGHLAGVDEAGRGPLAGPVDGAPPGLWVFSGFSGAFTAVPPLADTLAESVAASLAVPLTKEADRINHGGATPL